MELSLLASYCDYNDIVCGVEKFVLSVTVQMILRLGVFVGVVKLLSKAALVQALSVAGGWGSQICGQSHGKVVSLKQRPPLPPITRFC